MFYEEESAAGGIFAIQCEIQQQNIHARLTQKAQVPALCMSVNERANLRIGNSACSRNAMCLCRGGCGANMRIKPASRGRYQVSREWAGIRRILFLELLGRCFHAVDQLLIRRPEVRAAGCGGIVTIVARRGWARLEIASLRKILPDQLGAD